MDRHHCTDCGSPEDLVVVAVDEDGFGFVVEIDAHTEIDPRHELKRYCRPCTERA